MIDGFLSLPDLFNDEIFVNEKLNKVIKSYQFIYAHENLEFNKNQIIYQNFKDSKIAIIDQVKETNPDSENKFFIVCFKNTLIMIKQESINFLLELFTSNSKANIYFLPNTKQIFEDQKILIKNPKLDSDDIFLNEIDSFKESFLIRKTLENPINWILDAILTSLSALLIKQSYEKLCKNRFKNFSNSNYSNQTNWSKKEYIELRNIGNTFFSTVALIYHIENGELLVVKKPTSNSIENINLFKREHDNYSILNHPLIPKYYGINIEKRYLFIEFINGKTLFDIQSFHFSYKEKISIIFQLLYIFKYIHGNNLVYRDLKPNNVIIVDKITTVLIDFDRMISPSNISNNENRTNDFQHVFIAPEVNSGKIWHKSDIYSIGKMIYYIITEEIPTNPPIKLEPNIKLFYDRCTNKNPRYRPCIDKLFIDFFDTFEPLIDDSVFEENASILYSLGRYYDNYKFFISRNIHKAIHFYTLAANKNHLKAQTDLGSIYYDNIYVPQDINKAIHYFTLAAKQNDLSAQKQLAFIYYSNKYVPININKALFYYTLAANQNDSYSQNKLGDIYFSNEYATRDINKAIYYYTLAANQNHEEAQYSLGLIYSTNKYITQDINKSIYYYTLAANQNHTEAQYSLGTFYYNSGNSSKDINKAIHYFTLAANQNDAQSQFGLGVIYLSNKYIKQNINKAIFYFELAANQNIVDAQYNLGIIYLEGIDVSPDISKAIHYLTLAANQNDALSQLNLGMIYSTNKYIKQNINKSIYYFTLAANQNIVDAQYNLGIIYSKGEHIPKNANKAIHYFTLAAKQNFAKAQYSLGVIYDEGFLTKRDINKSIFYYTLAANQNHLSAQYNLGLIYINDKHSPKDIDKSIHYLTLAANQNYGKAQYTLGMIYSTNKYVPKDIDKSIHYLTLAANQNYPQALCKIGLYYLFGYYFAQDLNKAVHYFTRAENWNDSDVQLLLGNLYLKPIYGLNKFKKGVELIKQSAFNRNKNAYYILGFLYHEGKYLKQDIIQSIHYYKEASSFNNQYAKNNLGIIYKHGFGDEIPQNIGLAIEYFKEAIKQKNDRISMYNLAHLYFYYNPTNENINESIKLMIESSKIGIPLQFHFLSIILLKKFGNDLEAIRNELDKHSNNSNYISNVVCNKIQDINNSSFLISFWHTLIRDTDFLYDKFECVCFTNDICKQVPHANPKIKNITIEFYDGFGIKS